MEPKWRLIDGLSGSWPTWRHDDGREMGIGNVSHYVTTLEDDLAEAVKALEEAAVQMRNVEPDHCGLKWDWLPGVESLLSRLRAKPAAEVKAGE